MVVRGVVRRKNPHGKTDNTIKARNKSKKLMK